MSEDLAIALAVLVVGLAIPILLGCGAMIGVDGRSSCGYEDDDDEPKVAR